jgi:hypothetical protein
VIAFGAVALTRARQRGDRVLGAIIAGNGSTTDPAGRALPEERRKHAPELAMAEAIRTTLCPPWWYRWCADRLRRWRRPARGFR